MLGQRVTHRLDPFGEIAVLEQAAVKTILHMLHILRQRLENNRPLYFFIIRAHFLSLRRYFSGNFKVAHTEAGISLRNAVV